MYPFIYSVRYWDEIDSCETLRQGVTFGNDYMDAARNICDTYDADCVFNMELTQLEEDLVLELSESEVSKVLKEATE